MPVSKKGEPKSKKDKALDNELMALSNARKAVNTHLERAAHKTANSARANMKSPTDKDAYVNPKRA